MQLIRFSAALAIASLCMAQDRLTLRNGDVVTGTLKTMADGKVVVDSPMLSELSVPFTAVENLVTESPVELQTVSGETFKRRIAGIENASLRLDGDTPSLAVDSLSAINPPQAEAPKWTGSVSINGLFSDGNTRRRSIGSMADATRKTDIDRTSADASWDYAEDKPRGAGWNLTQRRAGAGVKYDYFLSERWYALATARVLGDTFADLALRATAGVGIGYNVITNERTTLTAEAGLSYFNDDYRSARPSEDYVAARLAYKLTHQINDRTKLNHGVEAYPSLEDKEDVYLQAKTEIVTNLTESMIASLTWIFDYDNTPSPGFKRGDHRVLLSVGWSF